VLPLFPMAAAMGHILPPLRGLPPLPLLPHGVLWPAEREPENLKMKAADLNDRSALPLLLVDDQLPVILVRPLPC